MKTLRILALFTAMLLGGCVWGGAPYYAQDAQYAQYAPQQVAPVGCIPPYYPVWNGCALPMPRPYYGYGGFASMYTYPLFEPGLWFNFNFGGRHHGGGRHYRGR